MQASQLWLPADALSSKISFWLNFLFKKLISSSSELLSNGPLFGGQL